MLRQSAKHQVGGEFSNLRTKCEVFLIQHTQHKANHPRVLQCGWKYLSRDFLKRKPQPEASPNPNCWTNLTHLEAKAPIPKKPLG